ncbi:MAG: hypothetical protein IJ088_05820 [Clostridia bacterium]|nr:hypothetical protein [Clostridia bacterium]
MIEGIRRRFIRIAVAVLSIAMILLAGIINVVNWFNVRSELMKTLENLSAQETNIQEGRKSPNRRQQNALDEARYFVALKTEDGEINLMGRTRIQSSSSDELKTIAGQALTSGKETGTIGNYLYMIRTGKRQDTMAILLNCETKMDSVRSLLLVSAVTCVGGILLAWLTMLLISSKAIQPMVQNVIRQKQFITDAGHELKTPLTVISANMDALSLSIDRNEWIEDTQKQVSNMRDLVNNLIYLSRMDEEGAVLQKETLNLSELVETQTESFQGMADFMGKEFRVDVRKDIQLTGERDALKRLISQLCENAIKYSPEGDTIELSLSQEGHTVRLVSENGLTERLSEDNLKHLFDRFYRPDASRSRESGGYGIGLSMARAIVERHEGRIFAEQTEAGRIRFVCEFPVKKARALTGHEA